MKLLKIKLVISVVVITIFGIITFNSCSKENSDTLYKKKEIPVDTSKHDTLKNTCDTIAVTYTKNIVPIVDKHCIISGCHVTQSPKLDSEAPIKFYFNKDKYQGVDKYKYYLTVHKVASQPTVTDCELNTVKAWNNQGQK